MLDPDEPVTHTQNPIEPPPSSTRSAAPAGGGQPTSRHAIFGNERTKDQKHGPRRHHLARATEGPLRGGTPRRELT